MITPLLLTAILAWGALAFGAVYRWAYTPLAMACALAGACALVARRPSIQMRVDGGLAAGAALVALASFVQLVPLPRATLAALSPAAHTFLAAYSPTYRAGVVPAHALSIDPARTAIGLALFAAFALFTLGLARWLSARDVRRFAACLVVLGVALALVGLAQRAFPNGRVYGFWLPLAGPSGGAFGPFINHNHFAGWMLMALPVALGYLAGLVARAMRGVAREPHARLIWFSTREANTTILVGLSILVMGLALVTTLSRSGITCFAIALALSGIVVARRQRQGSRRATMLAYLVFLVVLTAGWAGLDTIAARFSALDASWGGRRIAWKDTTRIIRDFPFTGTGLNTYGTAMIQYQSQSGDHFFEAHSDYLQLAAEGGALLVVPALVLLAVVGGAVRRRFRETEPGGLTWWIRVGAVTGIVAIALQETVEFGLQLPGNAALFATLVAIAVGRLAHREGAGALRLAQHTNARSGQAGAAGTALETRSRSVRENHLALATGDLENRARVVFDPLAFAARDRLNPAVDARGNPPQQADAGTRDLTSKRGATTTRSMSLHWSVWPRAYEPKTTAWHTLSE